MRPTEQQIKKANECGIKHSDTDTFWSYHNQILNAAYMLGHDRIDLSSSTVVTAKRFGDAPETGISHNYMDNYSERGCSVAWIVGREDTKKGHMMCDRGMVEVKGVEIPQDDITGSDGEPLILLVGEGVEE